MANYYTLTNATLKRLEHTGKNICRKCGMPLKIGDRVISKTSRSGGSRYHLDCYEKMFCEV